MVGAAGFLGRALVEALRCTPYQVSTFTRSQPCYYPDGSVAEGAAAAGTVFWLASQINPQVAQDHPELVAADSQVLREFLSAIAASAVPPMVVLVSSGGTVYGTSSPPPYSEQSRAAPTSAYGRAKLALEVMLAERAPGRAVVLRVANAYGPGQPVGRGQGVVAHWLRAARRGESLRLLGDPATTRDYIYVDDVARACIAVQAAPASLPPVINVGSGQPTTLRELAETVVRVVGDPRVQLVVEPARSFDAPHTWLDVSLARDALGWRPQTTLDQGVAAAWAAVRRLGDPGASPTT